MSILQRISYDLKGQKRAFVLSGVDLFVGPNGSGKTTALLAIHAGLRGLAESPGDAVKPYIGPDREGATELTFDVGTVSRDLSKTRGKDATRADLEAERIAGAHLVRWDLADFAGGTERDREALLRRVLGSRSAADLVLPESPLRAELVKAVPLLGCTDAGAWLDKAITWTRTAYTEANAANKTAKEGAESAQQALGDAPPGMLSTAKEAAERLEREIAGLRGEASSAKREAEAAVKAEANRQRAAVRHAALEAELVAIGESLHPDAPDLVVLRIGVNTAKGTHQTAVMNSRAKGAEADAAKALLQAPRNALSAAAARHNMLISLSTQVDSACAHCGAPDPLGILGRLAASQAEVDAANDVLQDAEIDAGLAQRTAAKAGVAVGTADDALDAANAALHAGEKAEAQRSQWRVRQNQIQADLADLTEAIQAPTAAPATFGGAEMLASLEEELAAARKTIDLHTRHAERGRLHQEAIVKREAAKVRFDAVKALGEALKALQASEAKWAFAPLSTATNELLEQMRSPFRLQVNSAADFGATDARRNGAYTCFWSLSDAERACVGAAMALALVRLSKSPWRALVMDGLEKMDSGTMEGFLNGVQAAFAAGWLANFVGALVEEEGNHSYLPGIELHWMGA